MSAKKDVELKEFHSIFSLEGRVAVITGGSKGLGLHIASGFLQAGCDKVFISARDPGECTEASTALNELSNKRPTAKAYEVSADISTSMGVDRLVREVSKVTDHVDIVVANAGTAWGAAFDDHPESGLDKVYNINMKGVFLTIQRLAPLLQRHSSWQHPSRVIIMGSVAGIGLGTLGQQANYGYSMSKAAVMHLARNLAVELGPRHILVNSVAPGIFPSKMTRERMRKVGGQTEIVKAVPNHRLGYPEDIAALLVFLSSRGGSHVNGENIVIDGGNIHTRNML